ncbi:MAG: GNAT family N-acetyltransferase [Candidatus Puniceispirillales bacterium]
MNTITIRPVTAADFPLWKQLYEGYADHYRVALNDDGVATTWGWLLDEAHPLTGLVAEAGEGLLGLAHFRAMPSPLRGAEIGFLDDLFVAPEARGQRIGAALLESLRDHGRTAGWPLIRWITRDDNYRARGLYDRHAVKSDWNTYEMSCDQPSMG